MKFLIAAILGLVFVCSAFVPLAEACYGRYYCDDYYSRGYYGGGYYEDRYYRDYRPTASIGFSIGFGGRDYDSYYDRYGYYDRRDYYDYWDRNVVWKKKQSSYYDYWW